MQIGHMRHDATLAAVGLIRLPPRKTPVMRATSMAARRPMAGLRPMLDRTPATGVVGPAENSGKARRARASLASVAA